MTGQDVMRCGSCGGDTTVQGGRFVCTTCDWSSHALDGLAGLLAEYLTVRAEFEAAADPNDGEWSPIRAECLEPGVNRLAREIADMFVALPDRVAVLV